MLYVVQNPLFKRISCIKNEIICCLGQGIVLETSEILLLIDCLCRKLCEWRTLLIVPELEHEVNDTIGTMQ